MATTPGNKPTVPFPRELNRDTAKSTKGDNATNKALDRGRGTPSTSSSAGGEKFDMVSQSEATRNK